MTIQNVGKHLSIYGSNPQCVHLIFLTLEGLRRKLRTNVFLLIRKIKDSWKKTGPIFDVLFEKGIEIDLM